MTKIEQLEHEIMALDRTELTTLSEWFQNFLADDWDRQIEADLQTGKADQFALQALDDHRAGRTRPL